MSKRVIYTFLASLTFLQASSQKNDSLLMQRASYYASSRSYNLLAGSFDTKYLTLKKTALPLGMIAYGLISLNSKDLKQANKGIRSEILENNNTFHTSIDNYLTVLPAVSVYGLAAVGVKGRHSFKDKSLRLGLATVIMAGTVFGLKQLTHQERPDGSDFHSFPSGHTANAFVGAEFLRQEYGYRSPWYTIAGYTVAGTTGALRMYNNKHWLSDVIAGAGIGILSTKVSYWVFNKIQKKERTVVLY